LTRWMMTSKGLSSVIGAVLLIFISVAAATSAWTFIDTLTEQTQDNVQDQVNEQNRETQSELTSEIGYNGSHGFTIITLRNSGSLTLPVQTEDGEKTVNMYVNGPPQDWEFMNDRSGLVELDPTESLPINTTEKYPSNGDQDSIRFEGPYGTSTTYVCYNSGTASC
jgi:FlaG/FlaF family flagellin (archaellin)